MSEAITVRNAKLLDAQSIFDLIADNDDQLIPRSMGDIVGNIDRFVIAEKDGMLCGCAAYVIHPEIGQIEKATVEVQSLAVKEGFRKLGTGSIIVNTLLDRARHSGIKEAIVLTFAPKFFSKLGFIEIPKTKVMHKLYTGCINCTKHANPFTCPEIAMTRSL
ncbi:MAG: GNAT family N-acetyltransferase [Kiritimatiellae bacterium]|nr:GNAT family N-acetyltransferase [Kiritimatiellia bacterium]